MRHGGCYLSCWMRVRLVRKLAREIDGIDLANHDVDDVLDLPVAKARLLMAEGWAIAERRTQGPSRVLAFRRHTDLGRHDDDDISRAS